MAFDIRRRAMFTFYKAHRPRILGASSPMLFVKSLYFEQRVTAQRIARPRIAPRKRSSIATEIVETNIQEMHSTAPPLGRATPLQNHETFTSPHATGIRPSRIYHGFRRPIAPRSYAKLHRLIRHDRYRMPRSFGMAVTIAARHHSSRNLVPILPDGDEDIH